MTAKTEYLSQITKAYTAGNATVTTVYSPRELATRMAQLRNCRSVALSKA